MLKRIIKYVLCLQIIFIFLTGLAITPINFADANNKEQTSADAMAVIESSSGRLLYSKDENKKLPMASTTKILTAIVAIENCKDLKEKHEIQKEAVGIEGSSIYLRQGEFLSIEELLYGLMLRSGNDSAVAIAIIVGGSVENFVNMMNDLCKKLGLKNTNIVTVNGLHDDNHYTTASDLAAITRYAMQNETFKQIVSTKETKIDNTKSKKEKVRFLKNKNKLLKMIDGADGVKTGYTKKAGKCFVGSATRNGMQIICVVLNCANMFDDCANLINQAFNEYKLCTLVKAGVFTSINIDNKKLQNISIILKKDIIYPLNSDEISKISAKVVLRDDLKSSIYKTNEVGILQLSVENNLIFSEKLYTINVYKKDGFNDYVKKIVTAF